MPGPKKPPEIPQAIREELGDLAAKLKAAQVVRRVYEDVLTAKEKKRIEEESLGGLHIANAVATVREISINRAMLDLARQVDLLTATRYFQLLKHTGEPYKRARKTRKRGGAGKPVWNGTACELFYNGKLIRNICGRKRARSIVAILDRFEEEGWPERIEDPLPDYMDAHRLRGAVRSLNQNLKDISFRMDGSGKGVVWRPL